MDSVPPLTPISSGPEDTDPAVPPLTPLMSSGELTASSGTPSTPPSLPPVPLAPLLTVNDVFYNTAPRNKFRKEGVPSVTFMDPYSLEFAQTLNEEAFPIYPSYLKKRLELEWPYNDSRTGHLTASLPLPRSAQYRGTRSAATVRGSFDKFVALSASTTMPSAASIPDLSKYLVDTWGELDIGGGWTGVRGLTYVLGPRRAFDPIKDISVLESVMDEFMKLDEAVPLEYSSLSYFASGHSKYGSIDVEGKLLNVYKIDSHPETKTTIYTFAIRASDREHDGRSIEGLSITKKFHVIHYYVSVPFLTDSAVLPPYFYLFGSFKYLIDHGLAPLNVFLSPAGVLQAKISTSQGVMITEGLAFHRKMLTTLINSGWLPGGCAMVVNTRAVIQTSFSAWSKMYWAPFGFKLQASSRVKVGEPFRNQLDWVRDPQAALNFQERGPTGKVLDLLLTRLSQDKLNLMQSPFYWNSRKPSEEETNRSINDVFYDDVIQDGRSLIESVLSGDYALRITLQKQEAEYVKKKLASSQTEFGKLEVQNLPFAVQQ